MASLVNKAYIVLLLLTFTSCSAEDSELKHDFGRTFVTRNSPLNNCNQMQRTKGPAVIREYLRDIAYKIIDANPSTFKGYLEKNSFCFDLMEEEAEDAKFPNAFALYDFGLILFNKAMLLTAPNDAAIAAVMGHELSHITMNHVPDRLHPKVQGNQQVAQLNQQIGMAMQQIAKFAHQYHQPLVGAADKVVQITKSTRLAENNYDIHRTLSKIREYTSARGEMQARNFWSILALSMLYEIKQSDLQSKINDANVKNQVQSIIASVSNYFPHYERHRQYVGPLEEKMQNLQDSLINQGKGASINWREQEADEVGLELYRRAGLPENNYVDMNRIMLNAFPEDAARCEADKLNNKIERGSGSHPTFCWRLYNTLDSELAKHKQDYAQFPQGSTEIIPGALAKVRAHFGVTTSPASATGMFMALGEKADNGSVIYVAGSASTTAVAFCEGINADQCRSNLGQAKILNLIKTDNNRSFFKTNGALGLGEGTIFSAVGLDSSNKPIGQVTVKITAAN